MTTWPKQAIQRLLGIEIPIIQAPMAGSDSVELATEVSEAGGLGSLGCALLGAERIRKSLEDIRKKTRRPVNLNFFCHANPPRDAERERRWKERLSPFYSELGAEPDPSAPSRAPFTEELCALLEELRPEVASFHFGLPDASLVSRLKGRGIRILSTATSVDEALWLEQRGCDAVIAQGAEAGGHRGMFLETDPATQTGTMALVPQIVDAVKCPVIAAGGIGDSRGIAAAFALGASAVQLGTAYLFCPESGASRLYREALTKVRDNRTVITNVFSGRPARGVLNRFVRELGPISALAPPFPLAGVEVAPLRKKSESIGSTDFMQLWSGQAAALGKAVPAGALTRQFAEEALLQLS